MLRNNTLFVRRENLLRPNYASGKTGVLIFDR